MGDMMQSLLMRLIGSVSAGLLYVLLVSPSSATELGEPHRVPLPGGGDLVETEECFSATGDGVSVECNTASQMKKVRIDYDVKVDVSGTNSDGAAVDCGTKKTGFDSTAWGEFYCEAGGCIRLRYIYECCKKPWYLGGGYRCVRKGMTAVQV